MIKLLKNLFKKKNKCVMSFKEGLDLTDLPVVTFYQDDKKLNFMLDTGANMSMIDYRILQSLIHRPTGEYAKVFGVDGVEHRVPYVALKFSYKDKVFTDITQAMDLSSAFDRIKKENGVTVHGLIGNAFMQKYKYVLDFKEMIAYSKQ